MQPALQARAVCQSGDLAFLADSGCRYGGGMGRRTPKFDKSLEALCPLQAREWHPTLNGDLKPSDFTPGSNEKVWWQCGSCGAEWQAIIANRTARDSRGCRSCASKGWKTPKRGTSLLDLHPEIAAELHPTHNGELSAEAMSPGSQTKVWWLCPQCGNPYQMPVRARTGATASGCPPCAYRRLSEIQTRPKPGESLEEVCPHLMASWHPTRNLAVVPSGIKNGSGYRAWWKCPNPDCGHEWQTSVANRTAGKRTGCPACSRAKARSAVPGKSFGDLHPDLLDEWHPTLNSDLDPFQLKPGSKTLAWWRCRDCGREWQTAIGLRAQAGTGCESCSYKERGARIRTPKPGESAAELFPAILGEWDWENNGDLDPRELKPGSDLKVWWLCSKGHRWQAHIYHRASATPTGCFRCVHTPEPGESFADLNPDIAREWHPTKNGDVRPGSVKPSSKYQAWWKCAARGHEWRAYVCNRSGPSASSCPKCTMWGTSASQIRIAYELAAAGIPIVLDHPAIPVTGRRPVAADMVIPDYMLIIEYDGSYHHARSDSLDKDRKQSRCLEEAGWTVLRIRPDSIEPVDEFSIEVSSGASIKAITTITLQKMKDLGYPIGRLIEYENDSELWAAAEADAAVLNLKSRSLLQEFPEIAAEWHPTRNGLRSPDDVNPGSKIPAWWLCGTCGHEWRVRPGHRTTGGTGCPRCAAAGAAVKKRTPKPGNSLAEVHPHLRRIFHPLKNGDLDLNQINQGTLVTVWWLCPDCGREWSTTAARNSGCRPCAAKRNGKRRTTPAPGESLQERQPQLVAQWHPTKNGDLLPSQLKEDSCKAIWWLCDECGHEWKRSPSVRINKGSGCRRCAAKRMGRERSAPGPAESLADMNPELIPEWHTTKNEGVTPTEVMWGSAQKAWWKCAKCGHEWQARIWTRAKKGFGCQKCAGTQTAIRRRTPKPGNSLADVRPELVAKLWHPRLNTEISPEKMTPSSHTKVWWLCPDCGNEWQATPAGAGCRPCSMKRAGRKRADARAKKKAEQAPSL